MSTIPTQDDAEAQAIAMNLLLNAIAVKIGLTQNDLPSQSEIQQAIHDRFPDYIETRRTGLTHNVLTRLRALTGQQ